jgi:hypothetical protein
MRFKMILIWFVIGLVCPLVVSCSLIFDGDKYVAKNDSGDEDGGATADSGDGEAVASADSGDGEADGADGGTGATTCKKPGDCGSPAGTGLWACYGGSCINCDKDGDGWASPDTRCDSVADRFESADCDDTDDLVYPHAPPICGDGKINSCDVTLTSEAQRRLGIEEIGFLGAMTLSSWSDPQNNIYPANFTRISQLSVTGRQAGEVDIDHVVAMVSFMDSDTSSGETNGNATARVITYDIWDGWLDGSEIKQYNLNEFDNASSARSVSLRRLSSDDTILAALLGADTNGAALFYSRIESEDKEVFKPTNPQKVTIGQNETCNNNATRLSSTIYPRLAITGQATGGLARTVWTQAASNSNSPVVVSHLYGSNTTSVAAQFTCQSVEGVTITEPGFVELSGSLGPFFVAGFSGQAFSWDGSASTPMTTIDIPAMSRPSLAFFDNDDYLAAVGNASDAAGFDYDATPLVCASDGTEPCSVGHVKTIGSGVETELAAMDNLGDKAAVLGLLERFQLSEQKDNGRMDEVVIRLLDPQGNVLTIGGVDLASESGSSKSEFPVFNTTYSSAHESGEARIVDLAVSSWIETDTNWDYPITILIAAIATTLPADATASGQPEAGDMIILGGIRGCRKR